MLQAGLSGVWNLVGARDCFLSKSPNRLWVPGFFSGVNQPGHEDSHLPASSAKVKEWSYTSDLCTCLHGMDRGDFTQWPSVRIPEDDILVTTMRTWNHSCLFNLGICICTSLMLNFGRRYISKCIICLEVVCEWFVRLEHSLLCSQYHWFDRIVSCMSAVHTKPSSHCNIILTFTCRSANRSF